MSIVTLPVFPMKKERNRVVKSIIQTHTAIRHAEKREEHGRHLAWAPRGQR